MIAAQIDDAGIVVNTIVVDELPEGYVACPEWVGIGMHINAPQPPVVDTPVTPVDKLKDFLAANPDVAALLNS